ncbi:MAG: lysylphosphatidylglycerol synthase transmembrane domain-containing protein [Patescibacteria group bacterium]
MFIIYFRRNYSHLKDVIKIKPHFLIWLVLLNITNKILGGFKIRTALEIFKIRLSFMQWFGASVINNFYNYLAPKSGSALLAVYFKNNHKLEYNKYLSTLVVMAMITILTLGIIGFVTSLYAYKNYIITSSLFILIFIAMITLPLILLIMPRIYFNKKGFFEKINRFLVGWHTLRKNKKMIALLFLSDVGILMSLAFRYYIMFKMFSLNTNLISCILIAPFNILMHFATIVPGGYGIKEAIVGFVSKLTNIGFDGGVISTLSDRIINMTVSFILGPLFSFILFKRIFIPKKEIVKNE